MKHLVIPDVQLKPGVPTEHLEWVGKYIVKKQPEVIVCIGDFADMPSLSSYDVGKKSFEGRRYKDDILSVHKGMDILLTPLLEYNERQRKNGKKQYHPRMVLTIGNHEQRIERAIENDPKLDGVLSISDLRYEQFGWEVYQFLDVVMIDGIAYSHYFTSGVMGRPVASAQALLNKQFMSCVMGHVQKDAIATAYRADGKRITGLFSGCCYLHDEEYMGAQGNRHFRGVWMLHNVNDGEFDAVPVPLKYLKEKYANNV